MTEFAGHDRVRRVWTVHAALLGSTSMLEGFEKIESNEFLDFGADPDRSIVLLVRKATGIVSAVEIERMLRGVMLTLGEPKGWSILFDTRLAVGRSGPEFEAEVARLREYMLAHYRRVA